MPEKPHLGGLPPRYRFMLNPYPDQGIAHCPLCNGKTGQRKLPLLIHADPNHLIALNYTCRYCAACDLLIGHKHTIEHLLADLFRPTAPEVIGNRYLILGTVEKGTWREGLTQPKAIAEALPHAADFAEYCRELRMTQPGWYKTGQEPPVREPPPSQEWVKPGPQKRLPGENK